MTTLPSAERPVAGAVNPACASGTSYWYDRLSNVRVHPTANADPIPPIRMAICWRRGVAPGPTAGRLAGSPHPPPPPATQMAVRGGRGVGAVREAVFGSRCVFPAVGAGAGPENRLPDR